MTPEQFCYWLNGFAEIGGAAPSDAQWAAVREHLATVFHKVTPQYSPLAPKTDGAKPVDIGGIQKWFDENKPGAYEPQPWWQQSRAIC